MRAYGYRRARRARQRHRSRRLCPCCRRQEGPAVRRVARNCAWSRAECVTKQEGDVPRAEMQRIPTTVLESMRSLFYAGVRAGEQRQLDGAYEKAAEEFVEGLPPSIRAAVESHGGLVTGLRPCPSCEGDGFMVVRCGCREAGCPHTSILGAGTDEEKGIYRKYWVRRTDGSSGRSGKHAECDYFVLDWRHDEFSVAAARAYAAACEAKFPELAADLRRRAEKQETRR